jgi:hypothetical protein
VLARQARRKQYRLVVTIRLTPPQLTVLRDTRDGHVYRSERGHDLYACYDRARGGNKKVSAIVERLSALGLVRIGEQGSTMSRPWHVTGLGIEVLAQKEQSK